VVRVGKAVGLEDSARVSAAKLAFTRPETLKARARAAAAAKAQQAKAGMASSEAHINGRRGRFEC